MQAVTEPVIDLIESVGELGVGALLALETVLPPIPSEVILPFAGYAAATGRLDPVLAWAAATVGSVVGAFILYGLGRALGYERLLDLSRRRWFFLLSTADLNRGHRFFAKHGRAVVFFGRFIPLVRSVVSVPAGIERMPAPRFAALTAAGSGIWNALFIAAGYQLGENYAVIEQWIAPVSTAVVVSLAAALVWLVVRRRRAVDGAFSDAGDGDGSTERAANEFELTSR
ncbi:hypothetical protein GCM10023153_14080 [Ornithinibacter aureus]|uniref:VTT domain-containing protein n=1 Tax=Ornithinibacter aureus TaxID=622664 RepID=A0ABP8JNZ9_9MICO|nr:DedA family protein [Ornithinibacter aureus]KAF0835269.1 membrane protein DedA with SNARE-associated domain [Ornithinibacter aureus]